MERNPNSIRSMKWVKRNSLNNPSCERYIRSLIENYFNFQFYEIREYDSNEMALWITYGCFSYIIEVDSENVNLKILERNSKGMKDRYHLLKKNFVGDTCWFECLSWIKNRKLL